MLANYHTHTTRCHHAQGTDREYVEAAIQAGLRILGFADHCPWVFPDGHVSGMRLTPGETDEYFSSLEALKKEYAKDIKIYIGFEAEYCPEIMEAQDKLLADYPLDYMILGQHFLGVENHSEYTGWKTTDEGMLSRYVDTVLEAAGTGRYLYIAHPDLIHYVGEAEIYEKHMRRLCEGLKTAKVPVELNMLGLSEGRHYPNRNFLALAGIVGNEVVIGMDAHAPEHLLNKEGLKNARNLCKEYNLNLIDKDLLQ